MPMASTAMPAMLTPRPSLLRRWMSFVFAVTRIEDESSRTG